MNARQTPTTLVLPASLEAVRELGPWVTGLVADESRLDQAATARLELALHEVCVNVVDHAYDGGRADGSDRLEVDGWLEDQAVRLEVRDFGRPFPDDVSKAQMPHSPQVRGYGLALVRRLVDEVTYDRVEGMNVWRLVMVVPGKADA